MRAVSGTSKYLRATLGFLMRADLLHVVTAVSNPLRWQSRIKHAISSIEEWRNDGANVYVVECATGERPYELDKIPGITHIPVRAYTMAWNKECLLNIGVSRLPSSAKYIATLDADIHFRKRGWAGETVEALQLYPVIQPWRDCYDLGATDDHIQAHRSFCSLYHDGQPVVPTGPKFWTFAGGCYHYAHTGYGWAYVRQFLEDVGGLLDICGMGSADHHMAYALVGQVAKSIPGKIDSHFSATLERWQQRAVRSANYKLGYVPQTIEHKFHGRKSDRGYLSRWDMFLSHSFNPDVDLKKNSYGVVEFSGNKPELEREFEQYLLSRQEDINISG
jgi:hypothetical protein